ncbi:unnamed protein product [Rangifer tarandus platyrhynchus]|uniref:Uncharacterized protein n=1 Tax=Rangifer tarandus platyrhynchus TaxID=3082113 RepID=A0ABN8ZR59_RANTA|nr:unnamed protein product [Rangifer tarandus platyrhynchus]
MYLALYRLLETIMTKLYLLLGFPGSSDVKESACNVGDLGSVPGLGRSPGGGHGNPLQYSCLENPHRQRSLVDYSPWGSKELDTAKQLRYLKYLLLDFELLECKINIWPSLYSFYLTYCSSCLSPRLVYDISYYFLY